MLSLSDFKKVEVDVTVGQVPFDEPGVFKCKVKNITFKGAHTRGKDTFDLSYTVELEESLVASDKTAKRSTTVEGRLPSNATDGQKKYFKHNLYMLLASMAGNSEKVDNALSKSTSTSVPAAFQQAVQDLNLIGEEFTVKIVRKKTKKGQFYFTIPLPSWDARRPFLSKDGSIVSYIAELDDNLDSYSNGSHEAEEGTQVEESTQVEDDLPFDEDASEEDDE